MAPEPPDYALLLRAAVADYSGRRERSVRRAADVFEFYEALWGDPRLERPARAIVAAVLAYFVVRDDFLPDGEDGEPGYLDDLYVAAHAFRLLQGSADPDALREAWRFEGEVEEVMDEIHADTRCELGKHAREVLRLAGLA